MPILFKNNLANGSIQGKNSLDMIFYLKYFLLSVDSDGRNLTVSIKK